MQVGRCGAPVRLSRHVLEGGAPLPSPRFGRSDGSLIEADNITEPDSSSHGAAHHRPALIPPVGTTPHWLSPAPVDGIEGPRPLQYAVAWPRLFEYRACRPKAETGPLGAYEPRRPGPCRREETRRDPGRRRVAHPRRQRVRSDDGSCYRSQLFTDALSTAVRKFTRPDRPQTNGTIESFHRTLVFEWAYANHYSSDAARAATYQAWINSCDHRPLTGIGGKSPINDVTTSMRRSLHRLPGQCRRP